MKVKKKQKIYQKDVLIRQKTIEYRRHGQRRVIGRREQDGGNLLVELYYI